MSERRYGLFQRSFSVPDSVEAEKITAALQERRSDGHDARRAQRARRKEKKIEVREEADAGCSQMLPAQ